MMHLVRYWSRIVICFTEHVDDIITLIYQYIHLLRKEGTKEWIFNECRVCIVK